MPTKILKTFGVILYLIYIPSAGNAQRFLSDYDSTLFIRDTVLQTVRRFENLIFSGYMQPQFQLVQKEGASTFEGGNFGENVNNRFMLRRARIKIDYILPSKHNGFPLALFTFQFEATERDLNIRDMFLRLYEPKKKKFSLTMGLFARPFGYEVNLSSSYRESPERGRMSQILMPSERDLGAMISYEIQRPFGKKLPLKWDIGLFNGQGKSGPAEFDSFKDLISRLTLKPFRLSDNLSMSGGLSLLSGGWRQDTKYQFKTKNQGGHPLFVVDSNLSNIGKKAPRKYYGADVQLVLKHTWGKTEGRIEYWKGSQPGTATSTANPGSLPPGPTYIRNFDGAFFYFIQSIINPNWELLLKSEWYDHNTKITADHIGKPGTNFTEAYIRFQTFGVGLTRYLSDNFKILRYYSFVRNETTALPGFTTDLADNVLTIRTQLRF